MLGDGRLHVGRVDATVSVHRQVRHLEAVSLEHRGRVEHRLVLDAAGDDVPAARARGPGDSLQGQVVRLGATGGEDDVARPAAEDAGHRLTGLVDSLAGATTRRVDARRVPPVLAKVREHGIEHLVSQRRRRGVIEVDGHPAR